MFNKKIRPFQLSTDLKQLADLLQNCFADSMDEDGERYITYLREFSQTVLFTKIAERNPEKYSLPSEGFVYEEKGKVVGNITLSPMKHGEDIVYLISNVGVLPQYREKGIANLLTKTALEYIECQGVKQVWLQVKQDNFVAIELYRKFQFQPFMTRTTWVGKKSSIFLKKPEQFILRKRKKEEWEIQKALLKRLYPGELTATYGFEIASLQPNLKNFVNNFLRGRITYHWATDIDQQPGYISYDLFPDQTYINLWLAVPQNLEAQFIKVLIPAIQARLFNEIRVNYPEKECADYFLAVGMQELNTLVWKRRYLS